jgi:hypothetical protein
VAAGLSPAGGAMDSCATWRGWFPFAASVRRESVFGSGPRAPMPNYPPETGHSAFGAGRGIPASVRAARRVCGQIRKPGSFSRRASEVGAALKLRRIYPPPRGAVLRIHNFVLFTGPESVIQCPEAKTKGPTHVPVERLASTPDINHRANNAREQNQIITGAKSP